MKDERKYPMLMVDVILLTLIAGKLCVGLAMRTNPDEPFYGAWTAPGVMVRPDVDQDAEAAARRALLTKAGVRSPYLEQLYTFSGQVRDSRGWSASIAYYALVPASAAPETPDKFRWVEVDSLTQLPFDHMDILKTALDRVRSKTAYSALPIHLAPEEFTMSGLRKIYEQVLGGTIPGRTFERYIEQLDVLEDTGKTKSFGGAPAKMYRIKQHRGLAQLGPSLLTR